MRDKIEIGIAYYVLRGRLDLGWTIDETFNLNLSVKRGFGIKEYRKQI